ncbi:MAG: YqaE/Pmp3 family membrane protein [Verrucomicrobiales bacterium]|nr:YqaE/Pmp3 family membrane protein [Verrucomicrobiales bacterium]
MKEPGKDIIRIILAFLLPPLGVFLQVGLRGHFWLNVVLTLLGFLPGIAHALYIIVTRGPKGEKTGDLSSV